MFRDILSSYFSYLANMPDYVWWYYFKHFQNYYWRTKCYAKIVIQKLAMACLYNYSFATCIFAWNYEWIITWEQPLNWVRRDDTRHEKWNIFMPAGNFSKFIIIHKSKISLNEFKSYFYSILRLLLSVLIYNF